MGASLKILTEKERELEAKYPAYLKANDAIKKVIHQAAVSIIGYMKPHRINNRNYKVSMTPSENHVYALPNDFYDNNYLLEYDLENNRVIVYDNTFNLVVAWTDLDERIKKRYEEARAHFAREIRPISIKQFMARTNDFFLNSGETL